MLCPVLREQKRERLTLPLSCPEFLKCQIRKMNSRKESRLFFQPVFLKQKARLCPFRRLQPSEAGTRQFPLKAERQEFRRPRLCRRTRKGKSMLNNSQEESQELIGLKEERSTRRFP